jgi:hypothetical protein
MKEEKIVKILTKKADTKGPAKAEAKLWQKVWQSVGCKMNPDFKC